jgi:hypothetical protein
MQKLRLSKARIKFVRRSLTQKERSIILSGDQEDFCQVKTLSSNDEGVETFKLVTACRILTKFQQWYLSERIQ